MSSPKLWRGQTLDDRTAERRELLLGVGHELLGTEGAPAVTMRAVARAANLSPRYFYESFESVEALLRAVYDRTEDGLRARLTALAVDGGQEAVLRRAFECCGDYFEEDPRRARILLREPLADSTLRAHSQARAPLFMQALAPALGTGALLPPGGADLAVTATALTGALVALYLEWADGRLAVDRDRLAAAAVGTTLALVGRR